jgi:hypothetical protein
MASPRQILLREIGPTRPPRDLQGGRVSMVYTSPPSARILFA